MPNDNQEKLKYNILAKLQEVGITAKRIAALRAEICAYINMDDRTFSRKINYKEGDTRTIDADSLFGIAEKLGCDVNELYNGHKTIFSGTHKKVA